MFKLLFKELIVVLFIIKINYSLALNSYIYLPDKYIQEEISIGSLILDISEEIANYQQQHHQGSTSIYSDNKNDAASLFTEPVENQHFTFLEDVQSSTENTYFLLDSITGRITSKRYLDRESMCMSKRCMEICDSTSYPSKFNIINNLNDSTTPKPVDSNMKASFGNCKMNIKILVSPSYSIVSVNVIVQDINDNKPVFRVDYLNHSIPENIPIGYKIPIDLAYDPDIGVNSIQTYSLSQSATHQMIPGKNKLIKSDAFELAQNPNDTHQLVLVVKKQLDREKVPQYNLTITACDGGAPSNCGQLKLILNLVDINDHSPIFLKENYVFKVMENVPVGSEIGQITAVDSDDGLNGKIKYKLKSVSRSNTAGLIISSRDGESVNRHVPNGKKYFELDEDTGILRLNSPLDYETEQIFSLNVEARDCGVGSLPAYAIIEVHIIDANDNSPEISVSFLNSLHRNMSKNDAGNILDSNVNVSDIYVYLNENAEPNKFIALVSISDRDSKQNGELEWRVYVNGNEIKPDSLNVNDFLRINKLNTNSFSINTGPRSSSVLDRERTPIINVSIISIDHGKIPRSNMAYYNFSLVLLDVNDNAPRFDRELYELNINENNLIDQFIYQFKAIDPDQNENGLVSYFVENENSVYIEEQTGVLRAAKIFDREDVPVYEFYIIARDNSKESPKSTKIKCILRINDINDNNPRIFYNSSALPYREYSNRTILILRLDENIPLMTQLVKFHCDDADANENAKTVFMLLNSNDALKGSIQSSSEDIFTYSDGSSNDYIALPKQETLPFRVTEDGKFYVSKRLDREQQDFYDLTLVCQDSSPKSSNRLNTTLNLMIRISDINDNCPSTFSYNYTRSKFSINPALKLQSTLNKIKFINKDKYTSASNGLFSENYFDADIGKNGELKFELQTHLETFKLNITESVKSMQKIYKLNVDFLKNEKNTSFINNLKLGKYLIRIRISDNGNPSCIKNEMFTLYIGNDQNPTQNELIDKLNTFYTLRDDDTIFDYINDNEEKISNQIDDEDDQLDQYYDAKSDSKRVNLSMASSLNILPGFNNKFNSNDYLILFCLIAILVIIGFLLSLIGVILLCKNLNKRRCLSKGSGKKSAGDMLTVRNYREIELNNSSSANTSTSNTSQVSASNDDENQCEINNLLENDANLLNRLSLSLKSTDQSQSADSVLTYPKECITISNVTSSSANSDVSHSSNSSQIDDHILNELSCSNRTSQKSITFANHTLLKVSNCNMNGSIKNKIFNDDSYSSLIKIQQQQQQNRKSRDSSCYNEIPSQYVKIENNFNNINNKTQNQLQQQQQHQQYQQTSTFLRSFPQKLINKPSQQQLTPSDRNYILSSSNASNASSQSATTTYLSPSSSDGTSEVVIVASSSSSTSSSSPSSPPSSDTDSLKCKLNPIKNNDQIIKHNTTRQYILDSNNTIPDDDEEETSCLFNLNKNNLQNTTTTSSTTTNNNLINSTNTMNKNRQHHYLRSSAV